MDAFTKDLYTRYNKGQSLRNLGKHIGKSHEAVRNILESTGCLRHKKNISVSQILKEYKKEKNCTIVAEKFNVSRQYIFRVIDKNKIKPIVRERAVIRERNI